jgi:hypothetical protein
MDELNRAIMKEYLIENMEETPFSFSKDPEPVLKQLIFILETLLSRGYTLSVICPSDFVFRDNVLFLKKETHLVELKEGHFEFDFKKAKIHSREKCFAPSILTDGKNKLAATYASVGLFAFYLWTRKKKTELTENDYGELKGTKLYYFIRNTLEKEPILLYL